MNRFNPAQKLLIIASVAINMAGCAHYVTDCTPIPPKSHLTKDNNGLVRVVYDGDRSIMEFECKPFVLTKGFDSLNIGGAPTLAKSYIVEEADKNSPRTPVTNAKGVQQ